MSIFTGSGVAIVTPFNPQGVNLSAFSELIDFQLANNTDAIVVCGTTGEPSTMTTEEKEAVIEFAVQKVNGRVPVIAGTGGNNTASVILASQKAQKLGADALLIVTPYYNKTTPKGLVEHYTAVADAVNIPIIVYNVPGRTGLNMTPDVLYQLSEHPNICGIKEASGNIAQMVEVARLCGRRLDLYSGDDGVTLPLLSLGYQGVISVAANIVPKAMHDLVATFLNGDLLSARELQFKLCPLIDAMFVEVNPIPVKTALNLLGFHAGLLRLPLTTMTPKNLETLKNAMISYGLALK